MTLKKHFTEHPATVGESYGQHFTSAMGFSGAMLRAAIFCALHACLPFLLENAGSRAVAELHDRMLVSRARQAGRKSARSPATVS